MDPQTHEAAATASLEMLVREGRLDVERDAVAIRTLTGLGHQLDYANLSGDLKLYREMAAEARQWWALLGVRKEVKSSDSIFDS